MTKQPKTLGARLQAAPVRIVSTFQRFIATESASGIILLGMAILAIAWANSPWGHTYIETWETPFTLQVGRFALTKTLLHWINDGLMAVFFLVVGLEIKREVVIGELSSPRKSMLPIATALGGMIAPALIFTLFNAGTPAAHGWGIPMATDIAFALGILMLAGSGVPLGLKVMLTALAIVDDLGSVVVIAVFYTADLQLNMLGLAGLAFGVLLIFNRMNVRSLWPYLAVGFLLWLALLKSGVHATIGGVLLALTIPVRARFAADEFLTQAQKALTTFKDARHKKDEVLLNDTQLSAVEYLDGLSVDVQPPLQRLEHSLKNFVAFAIMPVFALANAGVSLAAVQASDVADPIAMGAALGLLLGKPIGIMAAAWLTIKLGWAQMPEGANWRMVFGLSVLAGIGFTMSLFVAELAYGPSQHLTIAKMGILLGTLMSGILGSLLLRSALKRSQSPA